MTCPKCGALMRTFDRLGVHVEQCESCRGIFLDYGELEQIVGAEQQHNSAPPPLEYDAPPPGDRSGYRPDSPGPYRGRPDSPGLFEGGFGRGRADSPRPYGGRRRRGLLEQLFD